MKNKKSLFPFKKKKKAELIDYCCIEAYNETGFVITLSAQHFITAVRSLIKSAKANMENHISADVIGVKMILKEQKFTDEPYGELFQAVENYDTPVFKAVTDNNGTQIEMIYSLRAFNGKILDFANDIIKTINKFNDKSTVINQPVRICVPDINDSFIEFNWHYR